MKTKRLESVAVDVANYSDSGKVVRLSFFRYDEKDKVSVRMYNVGSQCETSKKWRRLLRGRAVQDALMAK